MAHELAGQGFTPALIGRNATRLDQAAASLEKRGCRAYAFVCDVTRPEELERTVEKIYALGEGLDFLILNAGVVHVRLLKDFTIDEMRADLETDLWGAMLSARYFAPLVKSGGRTLFISSGYGLIGVAGYAPYCAAKAGVINFAAALRRELLYRNITTQVACPVDIDTPQFEDEQTQMPEGMRRADARGRVMTPEAAASAILRQCPKNRFLIVINREVRFLLFCRRILPRRWVDAILDRLFPRPGAGNWSVE
jgi:NAD(P)-dependent dehydrogenase (short-subunit alcohol dehydrogenase family)